jgi:hypothetical protein
MAFSNALWEQLLACGERPDDLLGPEGLFAELKKALAERGLGAELGHHLAPEAQGPHPRAAAAGAAPWLGPEGAGALGPGAPGARDAGAPRGALRGRGRARPHQQGHQQGHRRGAGRGHPVAAAAPAPALPGGLLRRLARPDPRRGHGADQDRPGPAEHHPALAQRAPGVEGSHESGCDPLPGSLHRRRLTQEPTHKIPDTSGGRRPNSYLLPVTCHLSPVTSYFSLLTAHCSLLTAHCWLPLRSALIAEWASSPAVVPSSGKQAQPTLT